MAQGIGKKKVTKRRIIALIVFLLGLVAFSGGCYLMWVKTVEANTIWKILLGVGAVVVIVAIVLFAKANSLSRKICPECAEKYAFEDIEYREAGSTNTGKKIQVYIRFECHCSNCGTVHKYKRSYTEAYVDDNGNTHTCDVEGQIERFYQK